MLLDIYWMIDICCRDNVEMYSTILPSAPDRCSLSRVGAPVSWLPSVVSRYLDNLNLLLSICSNGIDIYVFHCRSLRDGFSSRINPDTYQDRWDINPKWRINWHKTQYYCVHRNIPFNSWAGKRNKEEELQELSNLLQSLRWTIHDVAKMK